MEASPAARGRSYSVGANAAPQARYESDQNDSSKEKRTLTVEYIVEQTFRTITQMIVQARVKQVTEGVYSADTGQWVRILQMITENSPQSS